MSGELEVDSKDVIKLLMQFCEENGLGKTYKALQEESGVTMNTVESLQGFQSDVRGGRWDEVLRVVSGMTLPEERLFDLYEQILVEMVELQELDVARQLLRETDVLRHLSDTSPERYARLENLCRCTFFDVKLAYPEGSTKEKRRAAIADTLSTHITAVPKSRLVTLLSQAVKYQKSQGSLPDAEKYDIFKGVVHAQNDVEETHPTGQAAEINFKQDSTPESAAFSPSGTYFATGSLDGFIEVWDIETGKLRKDLKYQKEGRLMMHDSCVLALGFSLDGTMLVSGCQGGVVRVWKMVSGVCVKKFEKAHGKGITSVQFTKDGLQVLSTSFDGTARVHGLKSGKVGIKEFRGHKSYVNHACQSPNSALLFTSSSDGSSKIWDYKTQSCLHTISPPATASIADPPPYLSAHPIPNCDNFLLCSRNPFVEIISQNGAVLATLRSGKKDGGDFVCAAVSPKGEWIYCIGEDKLLYCFSHEKKRLEHTMKISDKEAVGMAHHPLRNCVVTWGLDASVRFWTP